MSCTVGFKLSEGHGNLAILHVPRLGHLLSDFQRKYLDIPHFIVSSGIATVSAYEISGADSVLANSSAHSLPSVLAVSYVIQRQWDSGKK